MTKQTSGGWLIYGMEAGLVRQGRNGASLAGTHFLYLEKKPVSSVCVGVYQHLQDYILGNKQYDCYKQCAASLSSCHVRATSYCIMASTMCTQGTNRSKSIVEIPSHELGPETLWVGEQRKKSRMHKTRRVNLGSGGFCNCYHGNLNLSKCRTRTGVSSSW